MNARLWSILAGTVGTLAMFATDPALAQQVSQSGSALEEIVVTARRREEAIQTVPIAINAFNQDQLNANRVVQFNDLQHYVPVGSSRVDLQACKLEYSIVSPK